MKKHEKKLKEDFRVWNIDPNMVHDRAKGKNALKIAMKSPTHRNRGKRHKMHK